MEGSGAARPKTTLAIILACSLVTGYGVAYMRSPNIAAPSQPPKKEDPPEKPAGPSGPPPAVPPATPPAVPPTTPSRPAPTPSLPSAPGTPVVEPATPPAPPPATPVAPAPASPPPAILPARGMPETTDRPSVSRETSISTGVFVNQKELTSEQMADLKRIYGTAPPVGRYWYDPRSGLIGVWGFEAAGQLSPGHSFGPLLPDSSRGNTGIFINGRQTNLAEAQFSGQILGSLIQGQWWMDSNGDFGIEGSLIPVANMRVAIQQAQLAGNPAVYQYRDYINRFTGAVKPGCIWFNIPGGTFIGGC